MKCATAALFCFLFIRRRSPAQSQKTLLLGLASISGGIETLYVTKKIGAFKRNGLDVDFLLLQGGSQALQVLLSGRHKTDQRRRWHRRRRERVSKAPETCWSPPTRRPCRTVSMSTPRSKMLNGSRAPRSPSPVLAARRTSPRALWSLAWALIRQRDVTIMQIGNQRERMSALLSGSVDGSVVDAPNTLIARQQGFVELAGCFEVRPHLSA